MLQKNVKVGGIYLTKIGGELRRVRVDQQVERTEYGYRSGDRQVTRFRVTELRSGKTLPKLRSSSSLRECAEPAPSAIHCKWCRRAFPLIDLPLAVAQEKRDAHERSCDKNPERIDVRVTADASPASVYAFELRTDRARTWVDQNVPEPSFLGVSTLVVEHRYARLLVEGLRAAGLTVV